ncbi:XK-related protein 9 [Bombina bombina]|uniref:XK-related protein 9 n=1 Tax=Bombina bombina TaxID=8345 RepID=UPI00235ABB1B|nr:XK-related protein 9 [Bombina bombina]XP_053571091.1 XK-related protein 9 [Bombina bombina]
MSFTRWNFITTIFGIFTFLFDIGADFWIAMKYFQQELYLFGLLTIFFMLFSTIIVQVFSYMWFKDDCAEERSLKWVLIVHLFLAGTILRYWYAVYYGYQATLSTAKRKSDDGVNKKAVYVMTDLSMLRCFKTYLESTPQLILQLYILMEHGQISLIQYASIMLSFGSVSWSTVDYQMSLRKSLPGKKGISVGLPMFTYLFYKLFTLTSWILSLVFLLVYNVYILTVALIILCSAGIGWTWKQHTDFCTTNRLEILYRIVVGLILSFTFFNVKGQSTQIHISIYYSLRAFLTACILFLCFYFKPPFTQTILFTIFSIVVVLSLGLGIISLILYYGFFHPTLNSKEQNLQDVADGLKCEERQRINYFIMP